MKPVDFFIPCVPPKSTHQGSLRIIKKKDGSQFVGKFKNSKAKQAEGDMISLFLPHKPKQAFDGPVMCSIEWTYPWRKSESKKVRNEYTWKYCDTRPDCDNLTKMVADIMTRLNFWNDDSQIAVLKFTKRWGDDPGIGIWIEELN